jgi:drug/metabolite transporter (DMT)-like permease
MRYMMNMSTVVTTAIALFAFAGNSVLCRLALGGGEIDAGSFTLLRILSGALVLFGLLVLKRPKAKLDWRPNWKASTLLFTYALSFSYAYLSLDTGVGALILFGAVQLSLIGVSWRAGHVFSLIEVAGVVLSFAGLFYLVLPTLSTPSAQGTLLMALSGVAWAGYTLLGRGSQLPLRDTAVNFIMASPLMIVWMLVDQGERYYTHAGIVYALLSGAIASGIGYAIWYHALKGLTTLRTGVVQLLVPIIASIGGVLFSNEILSVRLVIASGLVLGGLLIVVLQRSAATPSSR